MKFLKDRKGGDVVEWLTIIIVVLVIGGGMAYAIANTTGDQGSLTNDWIAALPAP